MEVAMKRQAPFGGVVVASMRDCFCPLLTAPELSAMCRSSKTLPRIADHGLIQLKFWRLSEISDLGAS